MIEIRTYGDDSTSELLFTDTINVSTNTKCASNNSEITVWGWMSGKDCC